MKKEFLFLTNKCPQCGKEDILQPLRPYPKKMDLREAKNWKWGCHSCYYKSTQGRTK